MLVLPLRLSSKGKEWNVVTDEELKQFCFWLQAKGNDPSVVLALLWIAEFEIYAEQDEEELREFKAWLREKDDPKAASALRFVTSFEETVEPDPMLKRLRHWLQAKGDDPTAVLVGWWLAEFEELGEENHRSEARAPTIHSVLRVSGRPNGSSNAVRSTPRSART
jgi:hypothetical protein